MDSKKLIGMIIGVGGAVIFLLVLFFFMLNDAVEDQQETTAQSSDSAPAVSKSIDSGTDLNATAIKSTPKPEETLKVWESRHVRVQFRKNPNKPQKPIPVEPDQEEDITRDPGPERSPAPKDVHY